VFLEDGTLLAFTRPHYVSVARPPYTDWTVAGAAPPEREVELPAGYSGPAAVRVGDTLVFSCRTRKTDHPDDQPGRSRTGLFTIDPDDISLTWQTNLQTEWGGDQSYAGMLALDDERLLVCYYDGEVYEPGVPKHSDIKLATLSIA
jgi:hypothetical protein